MSALCTKDGSYNDGTRSHVTGQSRCMIESNQICRASQPHASSSAKFMETGASYNRIYLPKQADGVVHGMKFSTQIKTIAAQEPFADLQDRLVGLAEITERIALERKNIMVRVEGRSPYM